MPTLVLGGAALASQLFSGAQQKFLASSQREQAARLKARDTTPSAFTEALALGRQDAAAPQVPGMAQDQARISRQTANVSDAVLRGGASSSQVQAALAGADARGQSALADLGQRAQAYRQAARQRLTGLLERKAQYQQNDVNAFDREHAALLEGALRNDFGGNQSIGNGVAGAASILASGGKFGEGSGTPGATGASPEASGAFAAMATRPATLSPTGQVPLPQKLPAYRAPAYSPIGAPTYDPFGPFQYGRY